MCQLRPKHQEQLDLCGRRKASALKGPGQRSLRLNSPSDDQTRASEVKKQYGNRNWTHLSAQIRAKPEPRLPDMSQQHGQSLGLNQDRQ